MTDVLSECDITRLTENGCAVALILGWSGRAFRSPDSQRN